MTGACVVRHFRTLATNGACHETSVTQFLQVKLTGAHARARSLKKVTFATPKELIIIRRSHSAQPPWMADDMTSASANNSQQRPGAARRIRTRPKGFRNIFPITCLESLDSQRRGEKPNPETGSIHPKEGRDHPRGDEGADCWILLNINILQKIGFRFLGLRARRPPAILFEGRSPARFLLAASRTRVKRACARAVRYFSSAGRCLFSSWGQFFD